MICGYFDGASRGNPGQAGAGVLIYNDDKIIWRCAKPLGLHTNNEAEYFALGILLDELERRGIQGAEIRGDSKLVLNQVTGVWRIHESRLQALAEPVIAKIKKLSVICRWVPREKNIVADKLSNVALDKGELVENLSEDLSEAAPEQEHAATEQKDVMKAENEAQSKSKKSKKFEFLEITSEIYMVRDGADIFAVDLYHGRCTCSQGYLGNCPHLRALREKQKKFDSDLILQF